MRQRRLGAGLLLLLLAGCQHSKNQQHAPKPPDPPPLAQTQRLPLELGWPALPPLPTDETIYQKMTPREAQCLAVRDAPLGNLLDRERAGNPPRQRLCKGTDKADELISAIRGFAAMEARNQAAGQALDLYYRLGEAAAQAELLERGMLVLADTAQRVEQLRKSGLPWPIEPDKIKADTSDLLLDRNRLRAGLNQLNAALLLLTGQDGKKGTPPIWPAADFTLVTDPIDEDRAVEAGLKHRAELNLLRRTLHDLDAETLKAVRNLLKSTNILLGEERKSLLRQLPVIGKCIDKFSEPAEVAVRRAQLAEELRQREEAVASDIRLYVAAMRLRQDNVLGALKRIEETAKKVTEEQGQIAKGQGSALKVLAAQKDELKARGDFVRELFAWQVARVKLRQAQGVLVLECIGTELCPVTDGR